MSSVKVIVAPDSFKEALDAAGVAAAMAAGVRDAVPEATVVEIPVADGGEGTAAAMVAATRDRGSELRSMTVTGPSGRPVTAHYGFIPAGSGGPATAVVELAEAAGIHLVPPEQRDIWSAGTAGVGELMAAALADGAEQVIVGLGGSVTTDGGLGMLAALGFVAVDSSGAPVTPDAAGLVRAVALRDRGADPRWRRVRVTVAGDVDNPLCGPRGAAAVFGPQKGASPQDVGVLDAALSRWAGILGAATGSAAEAVRDRPGSGAAGGVGAALSAVFGASMRSGAELLLDLVDFPAVCADADLVLTGEGKVDGQTGYGKAPAKVAAAAAAASGASGASVGGVPVVVFGGAVDEAAGALVGPVFRDVVAVSDPALPLAENLANTARDLRDAVRLYLESHPLGTP
ncbi:glycerate kinase [Corynebacterium nuruki]|uniref:glycerate kinase n=1 Tax=Corynebacterium nuruki TaxID=1032851 RepID=UPI0039BF5CEF